MMGSTIAVLNLRISLKSKSYKRQKKGIVALYCEAANYLLDKHPTVDISVESDANIMKRPQPSKKLPTQYAEAVWNKALRCNVLNDEYVLMEKLINGVLESIRNSMNSY